MPRGNDQLHARRETSPRRRDAACHLCHKPKTALRQAWFAGQHTGFQKYQIPQVQALLALIMLCTSILKRNAQAERCGVFPIRDSQLP